MYYVFDTDITESIKFHRPLEIGGFRGPKMKRPWNENASIWIRFIQTTKTIKIS